ncbi:4-(cytidine 5'-diphospho)-2-C-methyl-D-erythritol kinase [Aureibacter tunicatorum]|uniref:4-diphosphocytidyl-2-C-methyl-D-erythritol kinase n=1 Tax=Aureibacter tunicatorum TaxID=866807 RepID=A0AAE4BNQ9_9BACT|nr:4-(cytidine 5'-diphospho)-2-C-methyl-D-erythritol kinase [Aureibacter tunicatorum]MDR6237099.1 4-diphosphocytidyl-2-C-methyl-D-erythritol kinase [Aureibacter tunicatorum]BDD06091.1 4-diphosphocytidyl-2-C-methyl-D-erythritol kinase [Aureibacter tunicatorum]
MIVYPNSKINIGLFITRKREDNFHDIESCFYPIEWKEALEITLSDKVGFSSSGIDIPGNPDNNLCLKAYELLAQNYDIPEVHIHLEKMVPIGAGLGGGSADAAYTLKALNELFKLEIENSALKKFASEIGSDCPFFIDNQPAIASGTGTTLDTFELSLSGKWIMLINPGLHIGTAEAYSNVSPKNIDFNLKEILLSTPIEQWKDIIQNDFEASVFPKYPELQKLKSLLYEKGAIYASMTGSGSTIYGIFNKKPQNIHLDKGNVWTGMLK